MRHSNNSKSAGGPLHGLGVLVTRPAHQARGLAGLIEAAGGRAFLFPLIEIEPLSDGSRAPPWIGDLARYSIAVFVSTNAVDHGLTLIEAHGGTPGSMTLGSMEVFAVGRATARRLEERGVGGVSVPGEETSEGLLRLAALKPQRIAGKRILIVRGKGGRELLAETLRARGAQVDYAEVYARSMAKADPEPLLALWDRGEIGAVVATSGVALEQLPALGGGRARERILDTTLVVLSERLAAHARHLGFRRPVLVATDAGDAGLVSALAAWRTNEELADHTARLEDP